MSKKYKSMIWLFLIYLVAFAIGGLAFFYFFNLSLILRLMIADVTATLMIWLFSLILKNASVYDPYWSVAPPVILIFVLIYLEITLNLSIFLMIVAILVWSLRLTYNWARNWTGFKEQDWRYTLIYKKSPKLFFLTNLFGIQMMPTMIVFVQLIGAIYLMTINPSINYLIVLGFLIIIISASIQYIADQQMYNFKNLNKGEKRCIEEGLWKYSRHPNYFGEIMVWWGLYLMYFGSTLKLDFIILAPLAMTALFLFISIPMMEKKILKTRPEYASYQKRVSMLIPLMRKENDEQPIYDKT
jgi:steroid 5-alpha reductase family enzyme